MPMSVTTLYGEEEDFRDVSLFRFSSRLYLALYHRLYHAKIQ